MYILDSFIYKPLDWLTNGIIDLLLIIAALQLVKKVPDLINILFGTHIKETGGLKGRLAEMAGVGQLANKALASIGRFGKNVGKLAIAAPIAAGYFAADAAYHKKTNDRLRNNELFRKAKGSLLAAGTALRTGSVTEAVKTFDQAQTTTPMTKKDAIALSKKMDGEFAQYNYGPGGYAARITKADGTYEWRPIPDQIRDINGATRVMQSNLHGATAPALQQNAEQYKDALKTSSVLSATQKTRGDLMDNLGGYYTHTKGNSLYSAAVQNRMSTIYASAMDSGRLSKQDIRYMTRHGIATADQMKVTTDLLGKYESGVREGNRILGFQSDSSELRKLSTLGSYVSTADSAVKTLEEQAEQLLNDSRTDEATKFAFKKGQTVLKNMTAGYGAAIQGGVYTGEVDANGNGIKVRYEGEDAWLKDGDTRSTIYTDDVKAYEDELAEAEKARQEAEEQAKKDAEEAEKARQEAEKARQEAEEQAKKDAEEAKARAEEAQRLEAIAQKEREIEDERENLINLRRAGAYRKTDADNSKNKIDQLQAELDNLKKQS